jgi:putative spermidine/putrescine transport system permease protein
MKLIAGVALIFLALPLLVVVPVSFSSGQYLQFPPPGFSLQWYVRYLSDPRWIDATGLSAFIGLAVVALALMVGTLAAVTVARGSSRWRSILAVGCIAPMVIPNMVLALGVFFTFSQLKLVGTATGIVLAHSMLALPFVFITVTAALQEIDPSLERAANVLGAAPFYAFRRVTLPLLKPFLLTAALFAFIISFDEIVIALFLTSVSARTLPKMIWENITMFIDPTISAVSVILILLSSILVLGGQVIQARRSSVARVQP